MKNKVLFPMFVDLSEKKVLVVGGGKIATRRIISLLDFVGEILVVSPKASENILRLAEERKLVYKKRPYNEEDLCGADIVLAATDDLSINNDIYSACKKLEIIVNVASDRDKCDFHFPGIVRKDSIVIGINAGGNDHKGAKEMRQKLQKYLENE